MGELTGYRGASLKTLSQYGLSVGDIILVKAKGAEFKGSLLPRYEHADDKHIVLKLDNGYNVGIEVSNVESIKKLAEGQKPSFISPPLPKLDPSLPRVSILGTGGTIASRIDYKTGAVHPAFSAEELYAVIPELARCAQIETEAVSNIYSENMTPSHWTKIAEACAKKAQSKDGIVIGHGTDTMAYASAALSFALHGIGIPVVLVGSQRSTDRPSSDAALNMISAATFAARAPVSGVYVAMHAATDDASIAIHLGTKVRKNHTSRRDAFESVNASSVAYVEDEKIVIKVHDLPKRKPSSNFEAKSKFEEKVALIKFYPGFDPIIIENLVQRGFRGIVLEGTGLGHVHTICNNAIKRAVKDGLLVAMTSQCIWGRVRLTVYSTGRALLNLGVIPLEDILSETALVKMMWVLGNFPNTEEQKVILQKNIANEISMHSPIRGYDSVY
ncbi:MAG: Glu-tRNA(Gln) amidotransferase subunit GatD [Thaumarchaeota archaeon]|nr:Glu-tRNA(Gln) amidotransferase subunit GatD [Nitrososphaerota archaeon]